MTHNVNRGLGIGFVLLFESQIFPFMLSSAFTARTIVAEKGQTDEVQTDVLIAVAFSIVFSLIMGYFFEDRVVSIVGIILGIVLAAVYEWRGELL